MWYTLRTLQGANGRHSGVSPVVFIWKASTTLLLNAVVLLLTYFDIRFIVRGKLITTAFSILFVHTAELGVVIP